MIHAALLFAVLAPVVVVLLVVFAFALGNAAARGDEQQEFDAHRSRVGLSEEDMTLCQSRQWARRAVMAGACGLTPDLSSKRGRGADTPDRTTKEG